MKHFKVNNKNPLSTDVKHGLPVLLIKKDDSTQKNSLMLGDPFQQNIKVTIERDSHVHAIQELVPPKVNSNHRC